VWELNSYRELLSENAGCRHVVGSGLIVAALALLFVLIA
jgi:hypothetical protein